MILEKKGKARKPPVLSAVADISAKALDAAKERGYREGMREGRREQRKKDTPVLLIAVAATAALAQIPYLTLALVKRKKEREEEARRASEAEMKFIESVRGRLLRDIERFRKK